MKKQGFSSKLNRLAKQIRQDSTLSVGEACGLLDVGPWQIDRYAKILSETSPDITYSREHGFRSIVMRITPLQTVLDKHSRRAHDWGGGYVQVAETNYPTRKWRTVPSVWSGSVRVVGRNIKRNGWFRLQCRFCGSSGSGCYDDCECAKCLDSDGYASWRENNPDEYEDWISREEEKEFW